MTNEYIPPTNAGILENYYYGQLYISKKWYVRPIDWAGCWRRDNDNDNDNDNEYLMAGNIEKQFDSEQECIDYINEVSNENNN